MSEYTVVIAFDVMGEDERDAHRKVVEALAAANPTILQWVESWFVGDRRFKDIDRNDRDHIAWHFESDEEF